jgi:hypothetical protein
MINQECLSQQKNVYVVLGMSRSGTSAIARALKVLNIDLGDKLLPGDARNPKGFYEDAEVLYKINRGVSGITGDLWANLHTLDAQAVSNNSQLADYKIYAQQLLGQRFATTNHWGFKDPRTVNLLPFWQSVFAVNKIEDNYIVAVRHPLAAAHSNQKFAHIDIETGLLIWLITNIAAIERTHGKKRIVISYELMLREPRVQLERIHQTLSLPGVLNDAECDIYANEFLDATLSHHEFTDNDLTTHPALKVAPLCLQVYAILLKLARDEWSFDSSEFQAAWQEMIIEFQRVFPIYQYFSVQEKNIRQLERELRTMRKSVLWRMLYPLRVIDDALRSRRHKKRVATVYG